MDPPSRPKVYHITHIDNLPGIITRGLRSDVAMTEGDGPSVPIGMSSIKQRRRSKPVSVHPGTHVGEYVPFYFSPRSVMLYLLRCQNHEELSYQGGQDPIVHIECDLRTVVDHANTTNQRWAFTTCNASDKLAEFFDCVSSLSQLDWSAIHATQWRDPRVKHGKQAEFLLHRALPWSLVTRIGVRTPSVLTQVQQCLANCAHRPVTTVQNQWYYPPA